MTLASTMWLDRLRRWLPSILLIVAAAAIVVRLPSVSEPLGIDQSLWASAVRGLARGQLLYRDVWEQRPPGIYLTYLAGFSLLGWNTATVVWLDISAAALMTWLLYAIARTLGNRLSGAVAAALFAALTMPAWIYRNGGILERSVCETFIIVCVGLAAWCAVIARQRPSTGLAFGIGFWCGVAAVFKPNAMIYGPFLALWGSGVRLPGRSGSAILRALIVAAVGALMVPAVAVAWLWHLGLLADAKTAIVDFNRWYVTTGVSVSAYVRALGDAVYLRLKTDPLWLAGGVAAVVALWDLGRTRRLPPLAALATVWGIAAVVTLVLNGIRLFNTYFIHVLPPLALLAAWWLTDGGTTRLRRVGAAATALAMAVLLYQRNYVPKVVGMAAADTQAWMGRVDPMTNLDRFGGYANERGYSARANAELADYVRAHTAPEDRIFLFGINGAGVYFLADRLTAHRFLRANFFVPDGFPDPAFTLGAVVTDLRARRPAYVIFEQLHSESEMGRAVDALQAHPIVRSLLEDYSLDTRIEDFTLYRRRVGLAR